jgi:hypothetical protein
MRRVGCEFESTCPPHNRWAPHFAYPRCLDAVGFLVVRTPLRDLWSRPSLRPTTAVPRLWLYRVRYRQISCVERCTMDGRLGTLDALVEAQCNIVHVICQEAAVHIEHHRAEAGAEHSLRGFTLAPALTGSVAVLSRRLCGVMGEKPRAHRRVQDVPAEAAVVEESPAALTNTRSAAACPTISPATPSLTSAGIGTARRRCGLV